MRLFGPRYPVLRRVIVTTKTERSFRGVLWARRGTYLVLREVEVLRGRGETLPLPGEVLIDTANVDYMQVVS